MRLKQMRMIMYKSKTQSQGVPTKKINSEKFWFIIKNNKMSA